jgi:hypothetical protein
MVPIWAVPPLLVHEIVFKVAVTLPSKSNVPEITVEALRLQVKALASASIIVRRCTCGPPIDFDGLINIRAASSTRIQSALRSTFLSVMISAR